MNKALLLLVGTLFVANAHADILHREVHYPAYPERKYPSVEYLKAASAIQDSNLRQAIIDEYNQKTASAQLNDKILVAAFSTVLTGFVTMGFAAFMEWYQEFKVRKARTAKEIDCIQQTKAYIAQAA